MRVIGAGFGRTGTSSLKAALEILGFGPCYHMTEVFAHPEHAEVWTAAWRGKPVDWAGFLGGYDSAVDWPACTFYEDLMDEYPEAKVLLSVREPEGWYKSTRNTIYEIGRVIDASPFSRAAFGLLGFVVPALGGVSRMAEEIIWRGTFDGRLEDEAYAREVFQSHNNSVVRRVPKDKLLVYDVKRGWGPLCEFLNVPVPDEPFPQLNDTAEFRRRVLAVRVLSIALPAALVAAVAGILLAFRKRRV